MTPPSRPRRTPAAIGLIVVGGLVALVAGCVSVGLPLVPLQPAVTLATPDPLAADASGPAVRDPLDWRDRRAPALRQLALQEVYGAWPGPATVTATPRPLTAGAGSALGQAGAGLEHWTLELEVPGGALGLDAILALPADAAGRGAVPVLVMQTFCDLRAAFPGVEGVPAPRDPQSLSCDGGVLTPVFKAVFGEALITPPIPRILAAGWGVMVFQPSDTVPDDAERAMPVLARLTPAGTPTTARTGAIAAWAWTTARLVDALSADARIDAGRIALWGHSRNAKSVLLAAAMDTRPAAVIALQSGTGGAALQRDGTGETIAQITRAYPHWFAPAYAAHAGREAEMPFDQHLLLSLIAPRAVMLGSARRDRWADPHGAWSAARAAGGVWELFGYPPWRQPDLRRPDLSHPLITFMRPGLHGVQDEDWTVALDFLAARVLRP